MEFYRAIYSFKMHLRVVYSVHAESKPELNDPYDCFGISYGGNLELRTVRFGFFFKELPFRIVRQIFAHVQLTAAVLR
jgi:hypothetical protein